MRRSTMRCVTEDCMAEQAHDLARAAELSDRGGSFLFQPVGARRFVTPEQFSAEERQFFRTALEFTRSEVGEKRERFADPDYQVLRDLIAKAGELGLLGVDVGEEFGGLGIDRVTSMLVAESQAGDGSWATTFGAHTGIGTLPIAFFGTPAQKAKYLPDLASGRKVAAYALSEAGSGSDALGAKTVARLGPDGKHYVVNGGKMWITNGGFADVFVVFLKIDGSKFTAMIVERGTPGFTQGREEHKLGIRGSSTTPLIFEDCRVPVENVLGEIGKGHKIAFNILNVGRLKLAAFGVGGMKNVLQGGVEYASQRKQFGRAIAGFGLIREKLARAAAQIYAAEAMTYRAAGAIDAAIAQSDGSPGKVMEAIEEYAIEASIMKVTGSEWLFQIIDEVLQIHGGNGFVEDYPIERAYRDNRVNRIFEGTNEINRLLIPGMIFKRAVKGAMPLMAAVQQLDEELTDPRHFPPSASAFGSGPGAGKAVTLLPVGRLAAERRGAEMAKRQFIFAAKWAASVGTSLEERQEVLAALADVAIEVYAMDSVLGRTLATEQQPQLRDALCRFYCMESRERAFDRARTALAAVVPPGELDAQLDQLARLHKYTPVNSAEAREGIVPSLLETGGYPLSY